MKTRLHFLYAVAWTIVGLGVVLLGMTLWISTWFRDDMGLFINDLCRAMASCSVSSPGGASSDPLRSVLGFWGCFCRPF